MDQPEVNLRHEAAAERLDRNWGELLQELRVTQVGFQILNGFLISLPFQAGFPRLTSAQQAMYGVTMVLAFVATIVQLAPVITHRFVFARHEKDVLLKVADREARVGLGLLGLTLISGLSLVLWVVFGLGVMLGGAAGVAVVLVLLWVVLPARIRARPGHVYD